MGQTFTARHRRAVDDGDYTWPMFLATLDKKFLDPRVAERARDALFRLNQGTDDADSFFLRFDKLRVKGQLDQAAHDVILVEHLKKAGIDRSKKQVASHIQVLRNMWRGEPGKSPSFKPPQRWLAQHAFEV